MQCVRPKKRDAEPFESKATPAVEKGRKLARGGRDAPSIRRGIQTRPALRDRSAHLSIVHETLALLQGTAELSTVTIPALATAKQIPQR